MQVRYERERLGRENGVEVRDVGAGQPHAGRKFVHAVDCGIAARHAERPYHARRSPETR